MGASPCRCRLCRVRDQSESGIEVSRNCTAGARAVAAKHGPSSPAAAIVDELLAESTEFATLWSAHEVSLTIGYEKRLQHPEVGIITVQCQRLLDPEQDQSLLVFTATPGTDSYDKLQLLSVIGSNISTPR